ncbi:hypothetical protein J3U99_05690 [Brucella pituitosa]|uniref:hypothetical protein n=1 Tax=Brucella pituitosa TaxID=571256 RepID=UPI00200373FF|nr:hypothetical protein [Brucella pituitosa]MCK4204253.1 hypothetical protein [Brucella pituitosa]
MSTATLGLNPVALPDALSHQLRRSEGLQGRSGHQPNHPTMHKNYERFFQNASGATKNLSPKILSDDFLHLHELQRGDCSRGSLASRTGEICQP